MKDFIITSSLKSYLLHLVCVKIIFEKKKKNHQIIATQVIQNYLTLISTKT